MVRGIVLASLGCAGLAACDELAVLDDPDALLDLRGNKSCVRAINRQLDVTTAVANTTLPVVEVNQYIVDVPGGKSYICYTNDAGVAQQIVAIG